MSKELYFSRKALDRVFSGLDSDFERKKKLGEELWTTGFNLLNLLGKKTDSFMQKEGQTVALPRQSLSWSVDGLVLKTPFFGSPDKPEIYFGKEGRKVVIVVPHEGMPWVIPQEIGEIDISNKTQEIKYHVDEGNLRVILNFLKGVTPGKRE